MSVSLVGVATGIVSATPPTHQVGDLFIVIAFRDGSNSTPTLPAGWTQLETNTTNSAGALLAYKIAASTSETASGFTNATHVDLHVYRGTGTLSIGDTAVATGIGTTVDYPALTMVTTDGSSWVVGMAGHRSVNTSLETPPTGMTNQSNVVNAGDEVAGHDTNGGVTSWSLQSVSVSGTSSGWVGFTAEIQEASTSQTISPSLLTNSPTLYAPTVAREELISPSLLSNPATFFAPIVTLAAQTITPSLLTVTPTLYAPTVGREELISPSLLSVPPTTYTPSVTGGASGSTPKMHTLQDMFNGASIDAALWSSYGTGVSIDSGKLKVVIASGGANYSGIESLTTYDLTSSAANVKIHDAGNQSLASIEVEMSLFIDSNNRVFLNLNNGTLRAYKEVAGVTTSLASTAWSGSTKNYWRIRSTSGTTYWEYSADGKTWTVLHSAANPIAVTALKYQLNAGVYSSEATPTTVKFDDANEHYFTAVTKLPTSVNQDASIGTTIWRYQDYIKADDSTDNGDLSALGYASTLTHILRKALLVMAGAVITATNMAADETVSGVDPKTYGGNNNLWGQTSLTGADVNADDFGFAASFGTDNAGVKTDRTYYLLGMGYGYSIPDEADVSGLSTTFDVHTYNSGGGTTTVGADTFKSTIYYAWRPTVESVGVGSGNVYIDAPNKFPQEKSFTYDVFSRDGDYLGRWEDVSTEPTFKTDVNNLLSNMDLEFARNDEITARSVELLLTENDENLTTEDDVPLAFDTIAATGLGAGTDLDTNHEVEINSYYGEYVALTTEDDEVLLTEDGELLMAENGAPQGKRLFTGYISRWINDYGQSENIKATLLSHSNELKQIMLETEDSATTSFTTWDNYSMLGLAGTGPGDYVAHGQSLQVASTKKISRIRVKGRRWSGSKVNATLTLRLGTPVSPSTVVATAVTSPDNYATDEWIDFIFATPVTLTGLTTYSFEITTDVSKTGGGSTYPLSLAYLPAGGYSSGQGFYQQFGGSWTADSWDLIFEAYEAGGSTTVTFTNYTIDNMIKSILNFARSRGARVTYTADSIDPIDILIPTYEFKTMTCDEALAKCLELAGGDYYAYYDFGENIYHCHQKSSTPDRYAIKGKNVESFSLSKNIEHIINRVYFSGGDTGGGNNLYLLVEDAESIADYRAGLLKLNDSNIKDAPTGTVLSQAEIDAASEPQYSGQLTMIEDEETWIEDYTLGELFAFMDFTALINELQLQAQSLTYSPDELVVSVDSLPPKLAKQAADLKRQLQILQNQKNPSTPS